MTAAARPKPWHAVVRLKDELRSGELALAEFAADLHEVTLARGRRPVYEEPAQFFAAAGPLLDTSQIQDLADLAPKLLAASAGHALRFRVSAVLDADAGGRVPDDAWATVDALLATVTEKLKTE